GTAIAARPQSSSQTPTATASQRASRCHQGRGAAPDRGAAGAAGGVGVGEAEELGAAAWSDSGTCGRIERWRHAMIDPARDQRGPVTWNRRAMESTPEPTSFDIAMMRLAIDQG